MYFMDNPLKPDDSPTSVAADILGGNLKFGNAQGTPKTQSKYLRPALTTQEDLNLKRWLKTFLFLKKPAEVKKNTRSINVVIIIFVLKFLMLT